MPRNQSTSTLETCVVLYKTLSTSTKKYDSITFGYVFTIILSLGHRSPTWADQLTRDERAVLYAAQAHLTSLRKDKELDLGWLVHPRTSSLLHKTCSACSGCFDTVWNASFGQCGTIDSAAPLRDVSELVILPQCRHIFARGVRSSSWRCEFQCGMSMLKKIDSKIERLFLDLAWKHRRFSTYVQNVQSGHIDE
ncbi:hypothetical protein BDV93DRAFT_525859 [Ceratobasidium sp. AG-I]|nr:hypothetical protein BDV93DRAFT_525859 [Ceratobasidium sp. AG-I]